MERFAKAVQIIFDIGRKFLFTLLLLRKGTIEAVKITLGVLSWTGRMKSHIQDCLNSGRNLTEGDFDTSMLYFMMRHGQILDSGEIPSKGWGKKPDPDALRLGDDIERIRLLRNKLYDSHSAAMTEGDFNFFTKEAKDILHRWSNKTGMALLSDVDVVVNTSLTVAKINQIRENFSTEMERISEDNTSK